MTAQDVLPKIVPNDGGTEMLQFGPHCAIDIEQMIGSRGPIVRKRFYEWLEQLRAVQSV